MSVLSIEKKLLERKNKVLQETIKKKDEEIELYKEMLEKVNYGDTQDLVAILNETIERYNDLCGTLEEDRLEYERLLKEQSMINAEYRKEMEEILRKMR